MLNSLGVRLFSLEGTTITCPKSQKSFVGLLVVSVLDRVSGDKICTPVVQASCSHASARINTKCSDLSSPGKMEFKSLSLNAHRENSTLGKFGADMIKMEWSRELDDNALRWIQNSCRPNEFRHDEKRCRKTTSFDSDGIFGQAREQCLAT